MAFCFILRLKGTPFYLLSLFLICCTTCCRSLSLIVICCFFLSFAVSFSTTRCHSLYCTARYRSFSLDAPLVITHCHSLSLVFSRCITRLSFGYMFTGDPCFSSLHWFLQFALALVFLF